MKPASFEAYRSLRSERVTRPARSVLLASLGAYRSLRSKGVARPARRVSLVLLGGYISLRSEGAFHSARRVHLTPFEATPPMLFHQVFRQGKLEADRKQNYIYKTKFHCSPRTENQIISVKPSFTVRPARRMPLALLGAYRSPRPKYITRLVRSDTPNAFSSTFPARKT